METLDLAQYKLTERRIVQLTLVLGTLTSVGACLLFSIPVGLGILIGSVLAWLSFHWLEGALDALVHVSTAKADSAEARVPLGSILRLFGRYALIAAVVYAFCSVFKIPALSMLVGLCTLGAATICSTLYEVVRPTG
jgi:ATP synthase I chain